MLVWHQDMKLLLLILLILCMLLTYSLRGSVKDDRAHTAKEATAAILGEHWGKPVFLRIVKEERIMELWLKSGDQWHILKTYRIAGMSGKLGPKEKEGDGQAPEGFYRVYRSALNPHSNYHLSFNIGYPNQYDRRLNRTGSHIMVHGRNASIGCYAMTDPGIEEIYTLVAEALAAGQSYVPVQAYPFRMTPERMEAEKDSPHAHFWAHLMPGWQYTEERHAPYPDTDS